MDIKPFVDALRQDLTNAAEAGGEATRAAAERLAMALEPAVRLALMEALSQAAADITAELGGPVVDVRLQGREPVFVVSGAAVAPAIVETGEEEGDDAVTRITLRLPETLKVRAEELAGQRGQSLNTWLVNAARAAAGGSAPIGPGAPGRNRSSKRIQGWAR